MHVPSSSGQKRGEGKPKASSCLRRRRLPILLRAWTSLCSRGDRWLLLLLQLLVLAPVPWRTQRKRRHERSDPIRSGTVPPAMATRVLLTALLLAFLLVATPFTARGNSSAPSPLLPRFPPLRSATGMGPLAIREFRARSLRALLRRAEMELMGLRGVCWADWDSGRARFGRSAVLKGFGRASWITDSGVLDVTGWGPGERELTSFWRSSSDAISSICVHLRFNAAS